MTGTPLDAYDRRVAKAELRLQVLMELVELAEADVLEAKLERDEYTRAREQGG